MKYWLAIALGSGLSVAVLWCTSVPLGIPGEWTWDRTRVEPDFFWNFCGGLVAAAFFIAFIRLGWKRLAFRRAGRSQDIESIAWLVGLVAFSFAWLWIVQEIAPLKNRIGKSPFILYYESSSGYFTRARYQEPDSAALLTGYEDLMREGDVLHTGTHPPGLFIAFQGMIAACDASPWLSAILDQTQPPSFREACDVIAANARRKPNPRQMLPLDRRVLWLATLIVMFAASLAVIPLFGLIRLTGSVESAWIGASIWSALPAVAVFVPKSDVLFPLIGLTILWMWLTAWNRRSLVAALIAGFVTWTGLVCSLAFLPVLLVAFLLTIGSACFESIRDSFLTTGKVTEEIDQPASFISRFEIRRLTCIIAAGFGFLIPTFLIWRFTQCNLLNVWLMNYRNHAGFYEQYTRTYWKWLLVNLIELSISAGWPISLLAFVTCWKELCCNRSGDHQSRSKDLPVVVTVVFVWGLLWLTGKNSGEAARLWVIFLPWLIWLASFRFDELIQKTPSAKLRERQFVGLLAIQFLICLLTVSRVSGFSLDWN